MDRDTTSDDRPRTTCVVLVAAERDPDPTLRADLEGRGWRVSERHDPLDAMTELCLRLRTGHHAEHAAVTPVLVVVDPDAWPAWPAMRRALVTGLPQIAVHERHGERLDPVPGTGNGRPDAPRPERAAFPPPLPTEEEDSDPVPSSISREELDMLLQGGPGA